MTGIIPLKQNTAFVWKAGPFVDDGDGKSAETGLTIAQADIRITKNGGDYAQSHNSAGGTHDETGNYDIPLDTTDVNTVGTLRVMIQKSGALPVWQDFFVYPANVYDSLVGSDLLDINVSKINETSQTAGDLTALINALNDISLGDIEGSTKIAMVDDLPAAAPSAATIAAQVRIELATELARIDTAISTRLAAAGYTTPSNSDIASILVIANYLNGMLETDGVLKRFTANALELGPGGITGALAKTYTVYEVDGLTPMPNCEVWATSDSDGLHEIANRGYTNDNGKHIFYFNLPVGTTVYIWRRKSLKSFTNPDIEVIA